MSAADQVAVKYAKAIEYLDGFSAAEEALRGVPLADAVDAEHALLRAVMRIEDADLRALLAEENARRKATGIDPAHGGEAAKKRGAAIAQSNRANSRRKRRPGWGRVAHRACRAGRAGWPDSR